MKILPFKGILYDTGRVKLDEVVTLPYDKINSLQKSIYESRSPYSMVHLILPKDNETAGKLFTQWFKTGILKQDKEEAIYVYEEEYEYPKGNKKTRRGFVALLSVQPFGKKTIMPHERTFPRVVEDRMDLLDKCKANIEQIFVLYGGGKINHLLKGRPELELKDEFGIIHRLWRITDKKIIKEIQKNMEDAQLFIADGHHRYTASLWYKEKMKGDNYIMAVFIDSDNPGLTILPTHRVLKEMPGFDNKKFISKLSEYFIVKNGRSIDPKVRHSFGVYLGGDEYYTITLKDNVSLEKVLGLSRPRAWLYLDVNILHLLILKHIMGIDTSNMAEEANLVYLREENEAVSMVRDGKARMTFILNSTKIEEVKEIVALSDVMPHKSTDFYPKLHSGLVMRKF